MKRLLIALAILVLFVTGLFASRNSDDIVTATNSAFNNYIQDVIGNKNDSTNGNSIVSITKTSALDASNTYTAITNMQNNVDTIETTATNILSDVTNMQNNVDTIESTVTNTYSDVTNLQNDMDTANIGITNMQNNVDLIEVTVTNIQYDITNMQNNVDTIEVTVTNIQYDITNMQNNVDTIENASTNAWITSTNIENNVDTIENATTNTWIATTNAQNTTEDLHVHFLSASHVYPSGAGGTNVVSANTAWAATNFTNVMVPCNTITTQFDIHWLCIEAISANGVYEIILENKTAAPVEIGRVRVVKTAAQDGTMNIPLRCAVQPANSCIGIRQINSAGANATVTVSIFYNVHP